VKFDGWRLRKFLEKRHLFRPAVVDQLIDRHPAKHAEQYGPAGGWPRLTSAGEEHFEYLAVGSAILNGGRNFLRGGTLYLE
jgi:hypothetical protein